MLEERGSEWRFMTLRSYCEEKLRGVLLLRRVTKGGRRAVLAPVIRNDKDQNYQLCLRQPLYSQRCFNPPPCRPQSLSPQSTYKAAQRTLPSRIFCSNLSSQVASITEVPKVTLKNHVSAGTPLMQMWELAQKLMYKHCDRNCAGNSCRN